MKGIKEFDNVNGQKRHKRKYWTPLQKRHFHDSSDRHDRGGRGYEELTLGAWNITGWSANQNKIAFSFDILCLCDNVLKESDKTNVWS